MATFFPCRIGQMQICHKAGGRHSCSAATLPQQSNISHFYHMTSHMMKSWLFFAPLEQDKIGIISAPVPGAVPELLVPGQSSAEDLPSTGLDLPLWSAYIQQQSLSLYIWRSFFLIHTATGTKTFLYCSCMSLIRVVTIRILWAAVLARYRAYQSADLFVCLSSRSCISAIFLAMACLMYFSHVSIT